jgi:Tol biopolymer transport system component
MKKINNAFLLFITSFIFITLMISVGGCATVQTKEIKDEISNLSFSHDGKKVLFDRCRDEGCQIQVYDLETGELAAYQSPANERWTMARQSYDGKKIVFSIMPIIDGHLDLSEMQIAIMDSDGKNVRKLTTGPGAKLYPVFSHSGKKVLYSRAAYIRKQGKTPAAQYDAWEVDLATGTQTQLTYFKYFYMGYLTYFPDDERFIFYGEIPEAFPGLDLPKDNSKKVQEMIRQEQMKKKVSIGGVLTMKKGVFLPQDQYDFGEGFNAERPLLSKDGSRLLFEKSASAGKFYLYSLNGNHRHVGGGGSIDSAAISPDGELLGVTYGKTINIYGVKDGKLEVQIYNHAATHMENWDNDIRKFPRKQRMIPGLPSRIIN